MTDFGEARLVLAASPRSSSALLRLAVQKLCIHLGGSGKNLNADIAALVKQGLSEQIQQALDVVRVIGNNAVHPGEIDLRDDPTIALALFRLVNLIVESRITGPKEVRDLFNSLPENAKLAIEKRDKNT